MGIKLLWPMLEEARQERDITCLSWKTVAVDLSPWITQATTATPTAYSFLCLRTVFSRIVAFRRHQVGLVFVLDGTSPTLKDGCLLKRRKRKYGTVGRGSYFNQQVQDCVQLFEALGIPYIQADGEAEALCALLNQNGLVDACVTCDSDALLYGSSVVVRTVNMKNKLVPTYDCYNMQEVTSSLRFTRRHLVAFSGLLEGDYYRGVKSVGTNTCKKLVKELPRKVDLIERFQMWKRQYSFECENDDVSRCNVCRHPGSVKEHAKSGCKICGKTVKCLKTGPVEEKVKKLAEGNTDFPPLLVFEEFLQSSATVPKSLPPLREPSLEEFTNIFLDKMDKAKTADDAANKLLPILVSWQMDQLADRKCQNDAAICPVKIVKTRRSANTSFYEVEWNLPESFTTSKTSVVPQKIMKKIYGTSAVQKLLHVDSGGQSKSDDSDNNSDNLQHTDETEVLEAKDAKFKIVDSDKNPSVEDSDYEQSSDVTESSEQSREESDAHENTEIPTKKQKMILRTVGKVKNPSRSRIKNVTSRCRLKSHW